MRAGWRAGAGLTNPSCTVLSFSPPPPYLLPLSHHLVTPSLLSSPREQAEPASAPTVPTLAVLLPLSLPMKEPLEFACTLQSKRGSGVPWQERGLARRGEGGQEHQAAAPGVCTSTGLVGPQGLSFQDGRRRLSPTSPGQTGTHGCGPSPFCRSQEL